MDPTVETLVCPRCGRAGPGPLGAVCDDDGAARIERALYDTLGDRPDPIIGRVVAGRFPVVGLIGRGAYGTVYRAIQQPVGREVALKVMNAPRDATLRARFFREARVVARLTHPSTVTLFDYGEDDDGLLWMVLEFIRGRTLRDVVLEEAPVAPARAARLTLQVLGSLVEAHAAGLIHRDLKPANIMLATEPTGDERAKVLDFGMAKVLEVHGPATGEEATRTGLVVGTPRYLSPEQALARQVGPQTDVYALGVILFELLSGEPPFVAPSTFELLMLHTTAEVPALDPALGVPPAMEAVIAKAMAKAVEDRFADAQAMLDALRAAAAGAPTRAAIRRSARPSPAVADAAELSADDLRSVARQAKQLLPEGRIAPDLRSNRPEARRPPSRPSTPIRSLKPGPDTFQPPPLAPDALDIGVSATHGELDDLRAAEAQPEAPRARRGPLVAAALALAAGLAGWFVWQGGSPTETGAAQVAVAAPPDAAPPDAAAPPDVDAAPPDVAIDAAPPDLGPPPEPGDLRRMLDEAERTVDRKRANARGAVAAAAARVEALVARSADGEDKALWNRRRADLWQRLAAHQPPADARSSLLAARADLVGAMTYGSRETNFKDYQRAVAITEEVFGDASDEAAAFACAPEHIGDYLHRANYCALIEIRAGQAHRDTDPARAAALICSGARRFDADLPNQSDAMRRKRKRQKRDYGAQCALARRALEGP